MKYIRELRDGERLVGIYLCKHKQSAMTKNGKPYDTVLLQDKTGVLDGKIWDPNSYGIEDFEDLDYIEVTGDIITFAGALQLNIKRVRKAREGEYRPGDYLPVSSQNVEEMYAELLAYVRSVKNPWLAQLLDGWFVKDAKFVKAFKFSSAAKTVHHGFVGGLLEHTLSVTKLCAYYTKSYPFLNRDLLITAALLHDAGKTRELSPFPVNDYTDNGQLLGHIMMGAEMIHDAAMGIPGFPPRLESELKHCILAHHGELEYGSPKKPALAEAMALNLADNTDARMETLREVFLDAGDKKEWLGYNKIFESNLRKTTAGE
ncbi:MAG: HD domain-containing protein [Lachnospiraceae bacterium]|nr:HD domain-containing protein [Lachnospiraceae bacterium]